MISEVMNSVLLFAIFVQSDIQIENCSYISRDSSCTGGLVTGQCTSLCGPGVYDCVVMTCSQAQVEHKKSYNYSFNQCYNAGTDLMTTCVSDDGGNDNDGSGNGDDDHSHDEDDHSHVDDVTIILMTCTSTNGLCEQCVETEYDLSIINDSFSTCEEVKTHILTAYGDFEDYSSCFTPTTEGVSGYDMMFSCSSGGAGSLEFVGWLIFVIVMFCLQGWGMMFMKNKALGL